MIIYFSGVGNTKWVAQKLATLLDEKVVAASEYINHPELHEPSPTQPLGIYFPVYGWDAPAIIYDLLDRLVKDLDAYPDYLYFVCTMGDDIGKTCERLQAYVARYGWKFKAGFSVQMPNTYTCLPGFDVDSKDVQERKLKQAEKYISGLAKVIEQRSDDFFQLTPGSAPWLKSAILGGYFRKFLMKDSKFHVSKDCNGCGRCEIVCPVGNIKMSMGAPTWQGQCQMCLSCYHNCPHHAIHWGNGTKKKGQYKAPKA